MRSVGSSARPVCLLVEGTFLTPLLCDYQQLAKLLGNSRLATYYSHSHLTYHNKLVDDKGSDGTILASRGSVMHRVRASDRLE